MFQNRVSNFVYIVIILFFCLSIPVFAQTASTSAIVRSCNVLAPDTCTPTPPAGDYVLGQSVSYQSTDGVYNRVAAYYCPTTYSSLPFYQAVVTQPPYAGSAGAARCDYQEPPQCQAGPAGTHSWPASGNLTCIGSCQVIQTGDSECTGTPAEGGVCTATFDYTGAVCPDEGDDGGSGSSGSSSSGGGGSSSGQSSSSGDGGDGGDDGGGGSSSGSGSSGGSASSSGNGGVCPPGQISQGTLNGNAICVGQCPTGQYWGAVNGVYGCYGGNGSSSGSGSSDGTGECDPQSKDYAKCIGQINDVDDGLSDQIVGDATGEAEDRLNDSYDSLIEDVEEFSGIDSEFSGAPNQLMSALQGFLPAPVGCSNVPLTFMGHTASLDCNLFNDFKLAFGWFLSILTAAYIWSLATKPVQR